MNACMHDSFASSAALFSAGRDYCYVAQPNSLRPRLPECSTTNPCGACYGDCDMDSECGPGLTCAMRSTGDLTPVFGCSGQGIAGLDYCYDANAVNNAVSQTIINEDTNTVPSGDTNTTTTPNNYTNVTVDATINSAKFELILRGTSCTSESPCGQCEGSCNGNEECADDLACYRRMDTSTVPGCSGDGFSGSSFCWDPTDLPETRHLLLRH